MTIAGSVEGFKHGKCVGESEFFLPTAICVDPINPSNRYYVGDGGSIRYCTDETVSLVAGSHGVGYADGIGAAARFHVIYSAVCLKDGSKLFVSDFSNDRIRMVDTKTQAVTTIAGDGATLFTGDRVGSTCGMQSPRKLAFDRSAPTTGTGKPQSVLYITSPEGIRRLDLDTGQVTLCVMTKTYALSEMDFYGICSTSIGRLILTCVKSNSVYSYEPRSGGLELLAGGALGAKSIPGVTDTTTKLAFASDLVVVDTSIEQCVYIANTSCHTLLHMTLPV